MPENVRQFRPPSATCEISIDFSPHREAFSYSSGGTTYSPADTFYAHTGETITFAATVIPGIGQRIIGYRWDFGDGSIGYGNPATHKYTLPSEHIQVKLIVTDDSNRKHRALKAMYLRLP